MNGDAIRRVLAASDRAMGRVNTASMGEITKVDLQKHRADVKLYHLRDGQPVTLFDLPISYPRFAAGRLQIAPGVGDRVIVLHLRHDPDAFLITRVPQEANHEYLHDVNNAVVLAGFYADLDIPDEVAAETPDPPIGEGEIYLRHQSGAYLRISASGEMEIKASKINLVKL